MSVTQVRGRIKAMFGKVEDGVERIRLSTVHRAKGLEAQRVWVLRPDLMPHPMARQDWAVEQERNLIYVAVTRAIGELYWVGGLPKL